MLLDPDPPSQEGLDEAFWQACHGGQLRTAQLLLAHGARIDTTPSYSEGRSPLDVAGSLDERRSQLVRWLDEHGPRRRSGRLRHEEGRDDRSGTARSSLVAREANPWRWG
jgi:hypothetical protein